MGCVKTAVKIDDQFEARFMAALEARNRLNHGFFEKHNFRIQTEEGRDLMIDDLEALHTELFYAWQAASGMTESLVDIFY